MDPLLNIFVKIGLSAELGQEIINWVGIISLVSIFLFFLLLLCVAVGLHDTTPEWTDLERAKHFRRAWKNGRSESYEE